MDTGLTDLKKKEKFLSDFHRIERYFQAKIDLLEIYKNLTLEEILRDAPRHYPWIRVLEQFNSFIFNKKNWLEDFVRANKINFDMASYKRWKSGLTYYKETYDNTKAPSKWIQVIQDYLLEILKSLQILLLYELHINEDEFKLFLRKNPTIDYELKANYKIKSLPSEDIDKIFRILDKLLDMNVKYEFNTSLVCDTFVCMQAYREVENSGVFELLAKKEQYIKFRTKYLKTTREQRDLIQHENDLYIAAEEFSKNCIELKTTFNEYRSRLIDKYNKSKK